MSGKIVSGYDPLLKVTIFQRHLTHTCTQIEAGKKKEKKTWGLPRIVHCAHKIYVLWSPAVNTHCFSIKVHINPPIFFSPPPLNQPPSLQGKQWQGRTLTNRFCFSSLL